MPAPNVRMRLTVEVLPLAEEDAHGPHRATALAALKQRKFALPVQPDDTFELVWSRIEQRYKTNYLTPTQAAAFVIKKLQDAYDCDLDLGDTVSSIFEGETDRRMHVIKVVPSFINRDFSVPPTSHLRPGHSSKRHADFNAEHANKRRRVESHQLDNIQEEREPSPNRPIQSTETDHDGQDSSEASGASEDLNRSRSGDSLVFVHNAQTGDAEFSTAVIKAEPIDADLSISQDIPHTSAQPLEPAPQDQTPNRGSKSPLAPSEDAPGQQSAEQTSEETAQDQQQVAASPEVDSQEAALHKSPVSSVEQIAATPPPAATKRKDVYEVPSSPEFMQNKPTPAKSGTTYGRSPRTPKVVQNEVDLLNHARLLSSKAQETTNAKPTPTSSKKAHSFQFPKPDEIESTPQEAAASKSKQRSPSESDSDEDLTTSFLDKTTTSFLDKTKGDAPNGAQTPVKKNASKPAKPGSLRKASIKSLLATPATPASPATRRSSRLETSKASSVNTRAQKQLNTKVAATPPRPNTAKRNTTAMDTPSRMKYLQDLLKQATPVARRSESSPSVTKKSEEASTPLPASEKQKKGTSKPSEPAVETPKPSEPAVETPKPSAPAVETPKTSEPAVETPRPSFSAQSTALKATPIRSPVPLPPNVAHLARNATVSSEREPSSSKDDAVFKKPALRAHSTFNGSPVAKRATRSASSEQRSTPLRSEVSLPDAAIQVAQAQADTPTPKLPASGDSKPRTRSEVPLPANVRHLRGNGTPQKQLDDNVVSPTATPIKQAEPTVKPSNGVSTPADTTPVVEKVTKPQQREPTPVDEPTEDAIMISSRESSSTRYSDSLEEQPEPAADSVDGAAETNAPRTELDASAHNGATTTADDDADEGYGEDEQGEDEPPTGAQPATADQHDGKTESQPTPWNTQSWGFGDVGQQNGAAGNNEESPNPENDPADETEGKSRSASVASSTRSSPAVSRQPARFLSHSPTPDASESEDTSDEASVGRSKAASLEPANENEDSDSSSSSDSSDDEDVDMPDLPAESTTDSNTNAAPPSSPPLDAPKSTPLVPESSQPAALPHKTPVPLPSSQAPPHSSQSVSAQAAERRRFTGFRSLREQLADTRAPKTTTQTKTFDPRTMSLNKLGKGKPLVAFGDDDDSSDEESSSSSDSDSD
jgi:hypothetical protein